MREQIWRFAMGRTVALREDFNGAGLRRLAKTSKDAGQSRRLLALSEIYDGGKRGDAARIGDVGLQVIRDWVLRFNAHGPDGLIDGKSTGKPPKLNDAQRQSLARIVEAGPIPAVHGVVRWRRADLALWIFEEFGISLEESSVGRELRALGFAKISARPRHKGQNEFAVEDFKKTSRARWTISGAGSQPTPP
jgi:transposase